MKVAAIVNAANEVGLGCFIPNHSCIDNQIHSNAGVALRLECNKILQGETIKTGDAIITPAYNLPSDYGIHTVGPIVSNTLTAKEEKELASCYYNSLEVARKKNLKTIAFLCISTGVFHFPSYCC